MRDSIITKIKTWNEKRPPNELRRRKIREGILAKLDIIGLVIFIVSIIFLLVVVFWGRQYLSISVIVIIATFIVVSIQTVVLSRQADISKEQNEIAKYRYNPIIVVSSEKELSGGIPEPSIVFKVVIKNWGDVPALNVDYYIYKNKQTGKKDVIPTLDPSEERVIYNGRINSEDFGKMDLHVDIEYQNIFGETKSLLFCKPPGTMQFSMMS